MIGVFLPDAVRRLYPDQPQPLLDEFIRVYQQRADDVMTPLTVLIPGADETIRRLRQSGIACGIVTQKLRYRVEDVLRRDGLIDHFGTVIGGEDIPAPKPHPGGLLLACERLTAPTGASLYAGDTTIDAQTAANAAIPFVAVLTGVTTRQDFASFPTLTILNSVAALPAFFDLQ
jgi:phosphoglycolate phosphatase